MAAPRTPAARKVGTGFSRLTRAMPPLVSDQSKFLVFAHTDKDELSCRDMLQVLPLWLVQRARGGTPVEDARKRRLPFVIRRLQEGVGRNRLL